MFSEDDVKKLAKLAHLSLKDGQPQKFANELSKVFENAKKLEAINFEGIPPTSHVHGATNFFREDNVEDTLTTQEALQNAPDRSGNFIRVPIIIDQSGEH